MLGLELRVRVPLATGDESLSVRTTYLGSRTTRVTLVWSYVRYLR